MQDEDGLFTDYSLPVKVQNVAPVVTASPATTASEGAAKSLSGSFVDPGSDQWLGSATISKVGDLSFSASAPLVLNSDKSFNLNYVFTNPGTYDVKFLVSDGQGGNTFDTTVVTVSDVPPAIDPIADVATLVGQQGGQTISFSDPGADAWSYAVDPGTGTLGSFLPVPGNAKVFSVPLQYATAGSRTVRVEVSDQAGGADVRSFVVNVAPYQPPVVSNRIPDLPNERQGVAVLFNYADLTRVFTDPNGAASGLQFSIAANTNPSLLTPVIDADGKLHLIFAAGQSGTAQVTVRATNSANQYTNEAFAVQVLPDQTPFVAAAIADLHVNLGTSVQTAYADLTQVFGDPDDPASVLQFSIASNTNAGLVQPAISAGHLLDLAFTAGQTGTASITVRATDPQGASIDDTFTVSVTNPFIVNGTAGDDTIRLVRSMVDGTKTDVYLNGVRIESLVTAAGGADSSSGRIGPR